MRSSHTIRDYKQLTLTMHVKIRFSDLLFINSWTATLLRTLIWDIQVVLCRMVSASNLFWKSKNKQAVPLMRAKTHHPSCSRWIRWKIWTPFLVKCSLQWSRKKLRRNAMSMEHHGAIVHTTGSISQAPLWPKVGGKHMQKTPFKKNAWHSPSPMLMFANIHTNQAQLQETPITTCCFIVQCQHFCPNLRNFVESSTLRHSGSNRLGKLFWHHRLWTEEFSIIPAHTPNSTASMSMQNKHVLLRNEGANHWHRTKKSWNMILFWRQGKLGWFLRRWKEWFFNENRFL